MERITKAAKVDLPAPPRERDTAEYLIHQMQTKHFAGRNGLPQQLDRLADSIGCKGDTYATANDALNVFLRCVGSMRKGNR